MNQTQKILQLIQISIHKCKTLIGIQTLNINVQIFQLKTHKNHTKNKQGQCSSTRAHPIEERKITQFIQILI